MTSAALAHFSSFACELHSQHADLGHLITATNLFRHCTFLSSLFTPELCTPFTFLLVSLFSISIICNAYSYFVAFKNHRVSLVINHPRQIVEAHSDISAAAVESMWSRKLGFVSNGSDTTVRLRMSLASLMAEHPTDYTILHRLLADVVEATQLQATARQLLLQPLELAFYEPLPQPLEARWSDWLIEWLHALYLEALPLGRSADAIATAIRKVCPKFVPREWMLYEAYSAAEEGNHQPLLTLQELLTRPYDEQPSAAAKYFSRAPNGLEHQGGIGFMS